MTLASDLGILANGLDCTPAFDAAMANAAVTTIEFEPGHYRFNSQAEIASGKSIRGCGAATIFSPMSTFTPRTHLFNGVISTVPDSEDVSVSGITFDGLEIGHTGQSLTRIHGLVMRRTLGFHIQNVVSRNWSGYAFLVSGDDPTGPTDRHCSGVLEDGRAENSDVLYEIGMCRGVTVRRCHGSDGDGTIHAEDAFLAWNGAEDVLFEDIGYSGTAGDGLKLLTIGAKATKNIVVRRANFRMLGDMVALRGGFSEPGDAAYRNELLVEDSEFTSELGNGVHLFNVDGTFRRCRLNGYNVGVGPENSAVLILEDTEVLASNSPTGPSGAYGLYLNSGSTTTVTRGALRARGKLPQAYIKATTATLNLSPETILEP